MAIESKRWKQQQQKLAADSAAERWRDPPLLTGAAHGPNVVSRWEETRGEKIKLVRRTPVDVEGSPVIGIRYGRPVI